MKTQYIFIGTYAIESGGRYEFSYRTRFCILLAANHDGDPSNEARSIHTAMIKLEDSQKQKWAESIVSDYIISQSDADDLVAPAYWLSTSLTPSLSGLQSPDQVEEPTPMGTSVEVGQ